jgi:hypothetical protein
MMQNKLFAAGSLAYFAIFFAEVTNPIPVRGEARYSAEFMQSFAESAVFLFNDDGDEPDDAATTIKRKMWRRG